MSGIKYVSGKLYYRNAAKELVELSMSGGGPHASAHAAAGSDPITPASIGAEAAGTTATHAALTTGVHGAGSSTLATTANIATHAGLSASVHGVGSSGFEDKGNKGAASGYCGLDAGQLVAVANLGTGAPDGTKFLRDDRTWQVPAGGSGLTHAQVMSRVLLGG